MSDVSDRIAQDALKPQSTSVDGVQITRRSLQDQIAADQYLRNADATAPASMGDTLRGMCFKIVPPGGH